MLSQMNGSKRISNVFLVILIVFLVGACGSLPPEQVENTLTSTPMFQTPTVLPTDVALVPSETPLPLFPLENLRMAYIVDGNLYVQDGSKPSVQLTYSKKDSDPIFSDDGEKIIFHSQGINADKVGIYSINIDGSQQQVLITKRWLDTLGLGTTSLNSVFVPSTHYLLFNTLWCPQKQEGENCTIGLFLVDTDTGEIREFLKPRLVGDITGSNFEVSPDGKLVSIAISGRIDIFNINGEVIYRNIAAYTLSTPMELVPMQNWLPDSSGLILSLPTEVHAGSAFPSSHYTVWRYMIGGQVVQIPLDDQQPVWTTSGCSDATSVSPDGNWFIYTIEPSLYLGDLRDGHTQIYALGCSQTVFWSPDSTHFLYEDKSLNFFIGSVSGISIPVIRFPDFIGWIDASHYVTLVRSINANEKSKILVTEIAGERLLTYETGIYLPGNIYSLDGFVFLTGQTHK